MSEFKIYILPNLWQWSQLSAIGIVASGGTPSTRQPSYWGGKISWISPADLSGYNNKTISYGKKNITDEGLQNSSAKLLPTGSILFSSRAPIGYTAIAKNELTTNQGFKNIIPTNSLNSSYVYHYLKASKKLAESMASGTTFLELSSKKFGEIPIPIPPLNEQNRIVEKIEELFSDLDYSIESLKLTQKQLKVYRQLLLKQAFEGKLTEQWRKENNPEPAEKLLERIKKEHQRRYEQELENWKQLIKEWEKKRRKGKKPNKPKRFVTLNIEKNEFSTLSKIPSLWLYEKLGNVCLKIMDGTHFSPKNFPSGEYMYITAKNIREGRIDLNEITYVSESDHRSIYSRCDVKKGDVLYIKDGVTAGRAAVNNLTEEFSLLSSVGVFRTFHHLINPKFLEYYFNSETTRNRMLSKVAGIAITRLTLVKLNNSLINLCSVEEQEEIVRHLDFQFSMIDNLEQIIKTNLNKANILRQNILKKAFEGKLVEQYPDDEPASKLLERIKVEKDKYLEEQERLKKVTPKRIKKMEKELSIEEILKASNKPMLATDVWQQSKHKDDIEEFYDELKRIQNKIKEVKQGVESHLLLKK